VNSEPTAAEPRPAPALSESDPEALARYLLSFRWEKRNDVVLHKLVKGGLPLWRQILAFVPNPRQRGRALEIGSPPYHITLLLQKFRNYDLSLTGFTADRSPTISHTQASEEFGEEHTFVCTCFDAEHERFPYDDASFDLVMWCEVIEHLTENPVHTLSEIHRVLKPGGHLVLSTPNATRADSVFNYLAGKNIYDPYHLGAPLGGSRHSREYTLPELRGLLEGCGYAIERAEDIDIYPRARPLRMALRLLLNNVVRRVTGGHYRFHLFVRARKTDAPFRWHFPAELFDAGHLAFMIKASDSRVVIGQNDQLHTTFGWAPLEQGPEGRSMRRSGDIGDVFLLSEKPATVVRLVALDGGGELQVWQEGEERVLLAWETFSAPPGTWSELAFTLNTDYVPGRPIQVHFNAPGGLSVHSVEVE
jgi:SAM-dependent methyltransferase